MLNKLNFSVPEDVMRKIAQCAPGVVELVLIPLRQRLEERQRLRKQRTSSLQVPPHPSIFQSAGSPALPTNVGEGVWQTEAGLGDHGRDMGLLADERA